MCLKIKLFCFPHAGGLSSIFKSWEKYICDDIEIIPIELGGRGKRMSVPLYDSLEEAVEDLYKIVDLHLAQSDFAMFGHSLGALTVYEMIQKIKEEQGREPIHAFFSGRMPIHIEGSKDRHKLPDMELKKHIIKLGGTPPEIQEYDEILDIFLPIIRSDFKLVETYIHKEFREPLNFNISIFNGQDDVLINKKRLIEWKDYTSRKCQFFEFKGGHFYINDSQREVVNEINRILSRKYVSTVN